MGNGAVIDLQKAEVLAGRFGAGVPRYTSYPTAPHFDEGLAEQAFCGLIGSIEPGKPISVYIHIPFCDRLCWFCGCNTKHTLKYAPVHRYVDHLLLDMAQMVQRIGFRATLGHVHFGGGSPSFLSRDDMERISDQLNSAFVVTGDTEICVEIDPSDVTADTLDGIAFLGVTRASVGVQDFDPDVQAAINRPQSYAQTRDVIKALRAVNVHSINIDALYGLPLQEESRLMATIDAVVRLQPDRVALFGYAHVPWVKKHQQLIRDEDLPGPAARYRHASMAAQRLVTSGYERIGIDHFAKPGDPMAKAARAGHLYRNFQGYTTDKCDVLLGMGGSSISRYDGAYVQNLVATKRYEEAIDAGKIPAGKGLLLSQDDQVRAFIIEALMCRFGFDFADLWRRFGPIAGHYIKEAQTIAQADTDGLCKVGGGRFETTPLGRSFVRIVASRFDAYFAQGTFRYSRAV